MSSSQNKHKSYERASERRGQKAAKAQSSMFRPLAFDHCALSLQPFRDPVMSNESHAVFDLTNIVPFVQQHKQDPTTGQPMTLKDITKLHFHRLDSGKYGCPITFKEFTDFSHIVAIKTSGYVYSMDAVQELNIAANNWTCLISGTPFKKADIIAIQDPKDPARRNVSAFHHVKFGTKVDKAAETTIRTDPSMRRVMSRMGEEREKLELQEKESKKRHREELEALGVAMPEEEEEEKQAALPATSANFTMMGFAAKKETIVLIPGKKTARKGSVRLYTTHGQLDVTLHCDIAPVACENFLRHCASGYYKGIKFHRLIKGFMIQGGDPTGSGRGGDSVWGRPFQDEFDDRLKHNKRGILSMANSGPNTNKSQFFVMFSARPHLDKKHTVFGEVSGGLETLDAMEEVPTSGSTGKDVPLLDVVLLDCAVLFDPFLHLDEEKVESAKEAKEAESNAEKGEWFSNVAKSYHKPPVVREGVGKYLATEADKPSSGIDFGSAVVRKQKKTGGDFGSLF